MSVAGSTLHCMTETLTSKAILRLRMLAQGLHVDSVEDQPAASAAPRSGAARIASTAGRMLAVQGQDWRSARWALGLRTPGTTVDDVHEAFNSGLIVRSWPMRGTVHLLRAEDIGWMQLVTNRRVLAGAVKRREFLGINDATLDALVNTSLEALRGGRGLSRDELSDIWTEAGIEWQSNWRYHLIWWLCQNGLAVQGPVSAQGEPQLVLASEWIAAPRELHGDEALLELAARYAAARGAVSAQDLAWWAGITAREAKSALAFATEVGRLIEATTTRDEKTVTLWVDPRLLESTSQTNSRTNSQANAQSCSQQDPREWLLLPAFDEHLLGYQNRVAQLAPAHFERIVPGRNGMFLATVVRDGRVVGTWKKGTRKGEGLIGTPLPGEDLAAGMSKLQQQADAWGEFHGLGDTQFGTTPTSA